MKESNANSRKWTRIVLCDDIPAREGRSVRVGNREIAIFNLGDRFLAVESRCPHKGGPLADGIVSGASVICPLHGWKMSLETGEGLTRASASTCIQTFRTRVEQGVVCLEIPHVVTVQEKNVEGLPLLCAESRTPADGDTICSRL